MQCCVARVSASSAAFVSFSAENGRDALCSYHAVALWARFAPLTHREELKRN